jgi:hypothetical protein
MVTLNVNKEPEIVGILAKELGQVSLHLGQVLQGPLQAFQLLAGVLDRVKQIVFVFN